MVDPEDAKSLEGAEVGDFVTRQVQAQGRINIPGDYLRHHDLERGDEVLVIIEEGSLRVVESTKDKMKELFMEEE